MVPFLPGKRNRLEPRMLLELDPATADKKWLRELCLNFHRHPDPEVRFQCARCMVLFPQDRAVKDVLGHMIRNDASVRNRGQAIQSLILHMDPGDLAAIAAAYRRDPALRPVIDKMIDDLDHTALRDAIEAWRDR